LPWAAAWAVFARGGAGLDFLQCTVAYNQSYVLHGIWGSWRPALGLARRLAPELGPLAWLAYLGWRSLGRDRARRGWLGAWLALGLVALAASGRYYPHYAILVLPPLAVLAAVGLAGFFEDSPGWSRMRGPRALRAYLAAAALCAYAWYNGGFWTHTSARERTANLYHVATFVTAPQAAKRIQELCPPSRNLFIWGDEAELFYLAQRRPATRFLFTYPFTGEAPPWPDGDREIMDGILDLNTGAAVKCKGLDPGEPLQQHIFDVLREQYDGENSVYGFILGARKR